MFSTTTLVYILRAGFLPLLVHLSHQARLEPEAGSRPVVDAIGSAPHVVLRLCLVGAGWRPSADTLLAYMKMWAGHERRPLHRRGLAISPSEPREGDPGFLPFGASARCS